ncbi:MAG: Ig-like domain-containing protein, partial [Acidimicrobiales bacterium]
DRAERGVATCTLSGLAGGSYSMTAVFTASGGNFGSSTSPTLNQSVTAASTTTTLTSSANPSTSGTPVTFTATVTSSTGAAPVGTVNFTVGGTSIAGCGAVALASGVATCTTSALASGNQSVLATFTPTTSTNFATSNGTVAQNVIANTTPYVLCGMPVGVWTVKIVYGTSTATFTLTIAPGESAILLQVAD